jgi:WD40 repeat protein
VLEGHVGPVYTVAWSADQRRALSGSADNTVRLWDLGTGHCLHALEGHTQPVLRVALSADQRRALSDSYDNTVRLWDVTVLLHDVERGRRLRLLQGHVGPGREAGAPALVRARGLSKEPDSAGRRGNCHCEFPNHRSVRHY